MEPGGGIPEKYWELVEQYRAELIDEALPIVGNREDAEDVVQETFCEALKTPGKLLAADSIGAMLHAINRCNAVDRVRRKKRDSQRIVNKIQNDPGELATTGGFSGLERADFVANAIDTLTPKTRAVIVLHYFEHLTCKQIAERLKQPQGTVNRLLYEGLKTLFTKLENHVDVPAENPGASEKPQPPELKQEPGAKQ